MSNVEFPVSDIQPASFDATFHKDIAEFTACFRFLVESYNNGLIWFIDGKTKDKQGYFLDRIGWETGMERDGYQGSISVVIRNIPGGGIGGQNFPIYHHYNIPKNIGTSKEGYQNIFFQNSKLISALDTLQVNQKLSKINILYIKRMKIIS